MIEQLRQQLHDGGYSCVIANGPEVRTFTRRGVADLFDLLENDSAFLQGAIIADKVIGKGAAALMIEGGAATVYTDVISEPALSLFLEANVEISYARVVPFIENRDKTDWCPLEKRCFQKKSAAEIIPVIKEFIAQMRAGGMKS